MNKWDRRFLKLAKEIATWSSDIDHKVGVLLVSPDRRQLSEGYNGLPTGIEWEHIDLDKKNSYIIHAEANAILNAAVDITGWSLYTTRAPCLNCALLMIQKRIARVIMPEPEASSSWYGSQLEAIRLLATAGIKVEVYNANKF